ncbi:MAG TPA: biotin-dependent carboxyltransferase family protein [Candidatus Angelobacter sp.]|nr:biotin-dependent carboxyltransferase family protein [Candidatus Angelobacter sp.]
MIRVRKPGLSTTVQDRGRFGYAHLGISPCGAADVLGLRIANRLVGNEEYAPALEMTLLGTTLEFECGAIVALAGSECECKLGNYRAPMVAPIEVPAGGVLQCGSMTNGARTYLAVRGGLDVPLVMGSASTDLRGGFGGVAGRRLRTGDAVAVGNSKGQLMRLRAGALDRLRYDSPVRITQGSQHDWFGPAEYMKFLAGRYSVTEQSDRAGLRLNGEAITPREKKQLLTDGIPLGAIQVPADGQPIILFVDQQTTGGYPKIATVIRADMHRIGQLRPRDEIRFAEVSITEAIDALRTQERWFRDIWQQ